MGYATDFIGHVLIDPPLNAEEADYLTAFTRARHWDRPGGPYVVPDHPLEPRATVDVETYNRVAEGKPGLWCPWTPCLDGHCLTFDGMEKAYSAVSWMTYLIETFLAPGPRVSEVPDPLFDGFTFDHRCDGVVAASRRDSGELSLIVVTDNEVERIVVVPGVPDGVPWGELRYQAETDRYLRHRQARQAAWRRRLAELRPETA
jgi:hypothetical protein